FLSGGAFNGPAPDAKNFGRSFTSTRCLADGAGRSRPCVTGRYASPFPQRPPQKKAIFAIVRTPQSARLLASDRNAVANRADHVPFEESVPLFGSGGIPDPRASAVCILGSAVRRTGSAWLAHPLSTGATPLWKRG